MNRTVLSVTVFLLAILLTNQAIAEDVGLISINNEFQAQVAEGILGGAHTRVEGRYLVTVTSEQASLLERSGLKLEVSLTDVDPSSVYVIYPPRKAGRADATVAGAVDIGSGLKLAVGSPVARLQGQAKAVPLSDLQVRLLYIPQSYAEVLSYLEDFPEDTLADRINQDSIYAFNIRLEAFQTRYIYTDSIDAARDWMVQKLLDWGYTEVSTPEFQFNWETHYNVMAIKPGYAEPDKLLVVGGHYDSIVYGQSPGPLYYAPGADDNASGTTAMLELARILADVPLRKTIVFIAFSAEEVGLVGARAAARTFAEDGADLEVMFNYDMIGYDPNNYGQIDLSSGEVTAYRNISRAAALRMTSLSPQIVGIGSGSDHYAFYEQGFDVVDAIETDFNYDGWHTNLDVSTRMNFPYETEVIRMAAATVGYVANSAYPTSIVDVVDQGDGQSVDVFWHDCLPEYTYTLRWGIFSGSYNHSVVVPEGECSYVVDGLTEGQTYYFSCIGEVDGAHPPAHAPEGSGVSYVIPRAPQGLTLEPAIYLLSLNWDDNLEGDFSHYHLYRDDGTGSVLYQDNLTGSSFDDTNVEALTQYTYRVTAVDNDSYESAYSDPITGVAYTFDQGVLIVDETADDFYTPSQTEQEAFFDSIFAGIQHGVERVQGTIDTLQRQQTGPYSSVLWIDDDVGYKDIGNSEDALEWFMGYPTNVAIAGWRTIPMWIESPVDIDHMVYEQFGIVAHEENVASDFCGATGLEGWPSVEMDTDNVWAGKFPYIPIFVERPGATVIYTYDSFTDNPAYEGQPCGVIWEGANGKRVVLGFPLYWLTASSSLQVTQHLLQYFGEAGEYLYGDVDNSGQVDGMDLTYYVDYFWNGGLPPVNMNAGDVNGSCQVDAIDLVYMVDWMFSGGPDPVAGCVF